MRKIILAQEVPPLEDVFACLTPRVTGMEPLPRLSCLIGGEGETAQETPIKIECIWPRLSCFMGISEGEGSFGLGNLMNLISR